MSETTFRDDVETRLDAAERRLGRFEQQAERDNATMLALAQTANVKSARIAALEAEVVRLRGLLKSIEWVQDPTYSDWHFCPSCDATSDCMLSLKHVAGCKLHAALEPAP